VETSTIHLDFLNALMQIFHHVMNMTRVAGKVPRPFAK